LNVSTFKEGHQRTRDFNGLQWRQMCIKQVSTTLLGSQNNSDFELQSQKRVAFLTFLLFSVMGADLVQIELRVDNYIINSDGKQFSSCFHSLNF